MLRAAVTATARHGGMAARRRGASGAVAMARRWAPSVAIAGVPRLGVVRLMSSDEKDSHPDFAAQSKVPEDAEVQEFLSKVVKEHPVLLFMKGTAEAPRCGFSAAVVRILQLEGVDFTSADVLAAEDIREGIKKFSDWPTIPQLYVAGEFVGGCDIITDLHKSGELKEMLAPILKEQQKGAE